MKDWKKVEKLLKKQGARFDATKKGQLIKHPNGVGMVLIHKTPSDHRAMKNTIAQLRNAGFDL